jgi:hypothetical protein
MYSFNNQYPTEQLPFAITLSNGMVRTNPGTFTEEEIADAGFKIVPNKPETTLAQASEWDYEFGRWKITSFSEEQIQRNIASRSLMEINKMRARRDEMMKEFEWRYARYHRQVRLGLPPTDNLAAMDTYMQALADLPNLDGLDGMNIPWPYFAPGQPDQ